MLNNRARITASAAVALSAALILSACGGAKTSAAGSDGAGSAPSTSKSCLDTSGSSIKIGFLNSLTGTMAISETTVKNSLDMAANEINAEGGILGKKLDVVQADGASDPATFAEKAKELIQKDCVAAVFGGWTSSSRKAMLPVFQSLNSLLFYPVQYEGLESSPNIFYTGATTNQQILPGLEYLKDVKHIKTLYLVGSDYVFPRTANDEIKQWAAANGVKILGEQYQPLGADDWGSTIDDIAAKKPDAVFNTINGDSNVTFFNDYFNKGLKSTPVISVSIAEEEVKAMGAKLLAGQLTAWNYYETIDSPANKKFVADYQKLHPGDPTSDPMEAAYTSLYLYKEMVEGAKSFDVDKIKAYVAEPSTKISFDAPEGEVTVDGENHHLYKTARIGEVQPNGLINTVWKSNGPIKPDPYLKDDSWYKQPAS